MGGCQNYGPFLGTLNFRRRIIVGVQRKVHNFDNHPYDGGIAEARRPHHRCGAHFQRLRLLTNTSEVPTGWRTSESNFLSLLLE